MRIQSTSRIAGITIAQNLALVALALVALFYLAPRIASVRRPSPQQSCINILYQLDGAKDAWALENKRTQGEASIDSEINQYLKGGARPTCPSGGIYTYGRVGKPPRCSLAVLGHSI